jgi:eukaryotic-like serine/threonine-protein kinase
VVYFGSDDHRLYALNTSDGSLLWKHDLLGAVVGQPAVVNGVVYDGSSGGFIFALNATTGATIWSDDVKGPVPLSVTVANGVVYAGTDGATLYALNTSDGSVIWRLCPECTNVRRKMDLPGWGYCSCSRDGGLIL